jgi:hypothetical protein
MRTLGELMTALGAGTASSAKGVIIYRGSSVLPGPPGFPFAAVHLGIVMSITADEKGTLMDHGATFDESRLYP